MTLNKEFVPYAEALALKELGFDEPCLGFYDGKGSTQLYFNHKRDASGDFIPFVKSERLTWFGTPTFSQAFRWFRKKYGLFGAPNVISYEGGRYLWFFDINSIILPLGTDLGETYDYETYEEAELECLKKLIEITKTK